MSQQRTARRQPSLLVDPAQETVRRRCRDPINVENLLTRGCHPGFSTVCSCR
uniref:E2F transcription factor 6 n=1 Tax=Mus musculus TaxID=10090 RepID=A0A1Y7VJU3_MOUSE